MPSGSRATTIVTVIGAPFLAPGAQPSTAARASSAGPADSLPGQRTHLCEGDGVITQRPVRLP